MAYFQVRTVGFRECNWLETEPLEMPGRDGKTSEWRFIQNVHHFFQLLEGSVVFLFGGPSQDGVSVVN